MKILLINAIDVESDYKPFETSDESLALPYLAAYLRHRMCSVEIKIVDRNVLQEIADFSPDIVGLSFVTINFAIAKKYATVAKQYGAKVVAGGPHLSSAPGTLPEEIDVGVVGEGEETLYELVVIFAKHHWEDVKELACVRGIVFHESEGGIHISARRPTPDINQIPLPARDLFHHNSKGMITSRGCPYLCRFCFRAHLDRTVRYAAVENVVNEVAHLLKTYQVKHINIYDDMFTLPRKRFYEIVDRLVTIGIPDEVSFNCNIRPNDLDEELALQLKRLNVTNVFLGIESGVQRTLSYLKPQNATVAQNEKAIRILKEIGILTSGGIIIGSPDETREEIMQTFSWLKGSKMDNFEVMLCTPLPGTTVWTDALERGLVSFNMDWSRLDIRTNELNGKEPVIVSKTLTKAEIIHLYSMFIREKARWYNTDLGNSLLRRMFHLIKTPNKLLNKMVNPDSYINFYNQIKYLNKIKHTQ